MPKGNPFTKEQIEKIRNRTSKRCNDCFKEKSLDEFYNCTNRIDGKTSFCKECKRKRDFENKYGISIEQFDEMYKKQNGLCRICGCVPKGIRNQKTLHTDHDHITGKVRGLLCSTCNLSLGGFRHSTALLIKAIEYLEEFVGTDKQTATNITLLKHKSPN